MYTEYGCTHFALNIARYCFTTLYSMATLKIFVLVHAEVSCFAALRASSFKAGKRSENVVQLVQLVQLVKVTTFQALWPSHRYLLRIQKSTAEVK